MNETGRLTIRLPLDLLAQVQKQGGSEYVRQALARVLDFGTPQSRLLARPQSFVEDERELLDEEWAELEMERERIKHHERINDRREYQLDKIRVILRERREMLDEEWYELERLKDQIAEENPNRSAVCKPPSDTES